MEKQKTKVTYPIEAGRFSLALVNSPLLLIEQIIEQDFEAIYSSKSTTYPTYPHCLSNTKKKENILGSEFVGLWVHSEWLG